MQEQAIAFGPYLLFRSRKVLLESNRPVHLGSRAMDILIALVERAGEVVTKNELMRYAWPNTVVEENNLRVHVTAIRKILGDGQGNARYIVNMTGRGYSFVAPVTRLEARISAEDPEGRTSNVLPSSLTHVVGRDEVIAVVVAQVPGRRLVSITGPGGVGKTTVGLAAAQRLGRLYQRVCFVDLSVIEDVALVAPTLATAIGISALTKDPLASLIAYLRAGRFLLVLDNCEHVISRAAELAERLVKDTDAVAILATSREPLLAAGEYIFALEPLRSPAPSADLTGCLERGSEVTLLPLHHRLVSILSTLATSQGVSAVELATAMAAEAGLVSLFLAKLSERGFVFKDPLNLYWLGPQVAHMGGQASMRNALLYASTDIMDDLMEQTGQSGTDVATREGLEVRSVVSRGASELLRLPPIVDSRGPLYIGGAAKVMLAFAPQSLIDEVISTDLHRFVPASIRTRDAALALLEKIRTDGFYVSVGESNPEVATISAPVYDPRGQVIAVLALVGHAGDLDVVRTSGYIKQVVEGAKQIGRRLG
jgi:DNA-binding IclR family transcriptional regulator/DNA-binding winged helix-turn-helix (wHTH) protein